jgi:membrane protease YdiL (CAAX protease family)
MDGQGGLRPMGVRASVVWWAIPAAILYVSHYFIVPAFVQQTGQPYLLGYLLAYVSTMAMFLIAALTAYLVEGNPRRTGAFAQRFRLRAMHRQDWVWALGVLGFVIISYFGLGVTAGWLAQWQPFAPHPIFPPEFGPGGPAARAAGTFMGSKLTGLGWVAVIYLLGWVLNISGEELWFRGYILPRQEQAFGPRAWIANGLMFAFNHVWQPWNLLVILPSALLGAYAVQRRRNTWVLIVVHAVANLSLLVVIVANVLGMSL